ncbi:uracil-DNA glycosylase family protein [Paenibacillus kobensis]|uniref:uracil-DNA glycosylase family protein n=1 Tax=Paenibacillus kobensis TaxID=59841 RepID=UPI000FDC39B9|nr:uracil-DNA glycosylase family protein [Paenibacillus kobensis]
MLITNNLDRFREAILALPLHRPLTKEELLVEPLLMERSGKVEMYYAPHNEYANPGAKVVIVGLTPGWSQMEIAIGEARTCLAEGLGDEEVCRRAKEAARFAGPMRSHLTGMLDELGLNRKLQLASCGELFDSGQTLLHTTSVLRYPVFVNQRNYNGTQPSLLAHPLLKREARLTVEEQLDYMREALIIPLGVSVENVLRQFAQEEKLEEERCLWGFPHPSGANGHRHRQFAEHYETMKERLNAYFISL